MKLEISGHWLEVGIFGIFEKVEGFVVSWQGPSA
jgi:hypothetical protein